MPVTVEVELVLNDGDRIGGTRLTRRDGKLLWEVTVPANGTVTLGYRIRD